MTTPINSFQDILGAMERDPALRDALRRYILTDEVLRLPAQIKALTDVVEALVTETRDLRAGQEQIRADVGEIRADVANLRSGQEELRSGVHELRTNVGRLGGDVSNMMGTGYEGIAARVADRLVRRELGLTSPAVVMRGRGNTATPPMPEIDQAAEAGNITWNESDDLVMADVIVRATGQDGAAVYVVAEISITVQERDRVRAHRRAVLLERATGVTTIPVVIGMEEETPVVGPGVQFIPFDPDA